MHSRLFYILEEKSVSVKFIKVNQYYFSSFMSIILTSLNAFWILLSSTCVSASLLVFMYFILLFYADVMYQIFFSFFHLSWTEIIVWNCMLFLVSLGGTFCVCKERLLLFYSSLYYLRCPIESLLPKFTFSIYIYKYIFFLTIICFLVSLLQRFPGLKG